MDAAPRIAVDAMGGDSGPAAMIAGIARAHRTDSALEFLVYGDKALIEPELARHKRLGKGVTIVHTSECIAATEKPSQAIRRAKTTSMGMAINAVKEAKANAAVSGGNTGAMMAMAKLALRTMPGIDRPALAALLPTLGETDLVMLDLGANVDCTEQHGYIFRLKGAPEEVFEASVRMVNTNNSPSSIVTSDDHEIFERIQQSLATGRHEWADWSREGEGTSELPMRNQHAAWAEYMAA